MFVSGGGLGVLTVTDVVQRCGEFCVAVFSLFKTKSNTVTLCFLNTKQEEVESLPAAWGLALGISSDVAAQQGSCRAWTRG